MLASLQRLGSHGRRVVGVLVRRFRRWSCEGTIRVRLGACIESRTMLGTSWWRPLGFVLKSTIRGLVLEEVARLVRVSSKIYVRSWPVLLKRLASKKVGWIIRWTSDFDFPLLCGPSCQWRFLASRYFSMTWFPKLMSSIWAFCLDFICPWQIFFIMLWTTKPRCLYSHDARPRRAEGLCFDVHMVFAVSRWIESSDVQS